MLFVQLDANWPDNHKIIEAGLEGAGLHAIVMCLAKRQNTDGWVRRRLLYRQGADDELIDRLVDLSLLDADEDRVKPHDWHDRNPSQAAIEAKRLAKIRAGKKGNHERWGHDGPFDFCPICNPEAQVVAGSDRIGSHSHPNSSPESYTTVAIAVSDRPDPDAYRQTDEQVAANRAALEQVRAQTGFVKSA